MILQDAFIQYNYRNIMKDKNACEFGFELDELYNTKDIPVELLGIYISNTLDELFIILNADDGEITNMCKRWDNKINTLMILNSQNNEVKKLKYNVVQLLVSSKIQEYPEVEISTDISRKIVIKGDLSNVDHIIVDDTEILDLPFYMVKSNQFFLDEKKKQSLKKLIPENKKYKSVLEKTFSKDRKKPGKNNKSIDESDYRIIKEWLLADEN